MSIGSVVRPWKRGTAAQRAANTAVPAGGEIGVETDTGCLVVADGVSQWKNLPAVARAGDYAPLLAAFKAWAVGQSFWWTAAPVVNSASTPVGPTNIAWPDGATGVYTATSTDANGAVTAFTATTTGGQLGNKTATVTIPRDASSVVNGAITVAVA